MEFSLEAAKRLSKRVLGSFDVKETSDGKLIYSVGGKEFNSIEAAGSYIKKLGLTTVETFSPTKTLGAYHKSPAGIPTGPIYKGFMEKMARESGHTIYLHSMRTEDTDIPALSEILTKGVDKDGTVSGVKAGIGYGRISPGKEVTYLERWFTKEGRELTSEEIAEQRKSFGRTSYVIKDGETIISHSAKRRTADTTGHLFQNIADKPYTVGVYDPYEVYKSMGPEYDFMTRQASLIADDGLAIGSPKLLQDINKSMRRRSTALKAEAKKMAETDLNAAQDILENAKAIDEKIGELARVRKEGGLFNIRMMSFDLHASNFYPEGEVDRLAEIGGQVKGNVLFPGGGSTKAAWENYRSALELYGFKRDAKIDLISSAAAITPQYGESPENILGKAGRKRSGFVSVSPRDAIRNEFLDIQTHAANADFFDPAKMSLHTIETYKGQLAEIMADPTKLPGNMEQVFRAVTSDAEYAKKSGISQDYARTIIHYLDDGNAITDDPNIMRMVASSMRDFYTDKDFSNRARFLRQDALGAEVTNFELVKAAGQTNRESLPLGTIDFSLGGPKGSLMLNPGDIARYHEAFGGFDLDDLIRSHLRFVEETGEYQIVATRSPSTFGEVAVFNVDKDSQLMREIARRHGIDQLDQVDQIDRLMEEHNKLYGVYDNITADLSNPYKPLKPGDIRRAAKRQAEFKAKIETTENKLYSLLHGDMTQEDFASIEEHTHAHQRYRVLAEKRKQELNDAFATALNRENTPIARASADEIATIKGRSISRNITMEGLTERSRTLTSEGSLFDFIDQAGRKQEAKMFKEVDEAASAVKSIFDKVKPGQILKESSLIDDLAVMKQIQETQKVIGIWSNTKMVADFFAFDNEGSGIRSVLGEGFFDKIPQLEEVIDATTSGSADLSVAEEFYNHLQRNLGRAAAKGQLAGEDVLLDAKILSERMQNMSSVEAGYADYIKEALEGEQAKKEALEAAGKSTRAVDQRIADIGKMSLSDSIGAGRYSESVSMSEHLHELIASTTKIFESKAQYAEHVTDQLFSPQAIKDATFLRDVYSKSSSMHRHALGDFATRVEEGLASGIFDFDDIDKVAKTKAGDDVLSAAARIAGDSHERLFNAVGAFMQMVNNGEKGFDAATLGVRTGRGSMLEISRKTSEFFKHGKEITEELNFGDLADHAPQYMAGIEHAVYGENRLFSGTKSFEAARQVISDGTFKDVTWAGIKELFEHKPGLKTAGLAAAGLVVGSFMYKRHKDRTADDIQGPPLLPGGNPYEDIPQSSLEMPQSPYSGHGTGTTYRINAVGDFDASVFADDIGTMSNMLVNTNAYRTRRPSFEDSLKTLSEGY